jgi:hypothetical protein
MFVLAHSSLPIGDPSTPKQGHLQSYISVTDFIAHYQSAEISKGLKQPVTDRALIDNGLYKLVTDRFDICNRLFYHPLQRIYVPVLMVDYRIKLHMDLQADKSPVVVKGPFFPRVVNPRYRIRGTMCNARIQSSKARKAIFSRTKLHLI